MLPVAVEDFSKLNELAENSMIVRQPDKKDSIKQYRIFLLKKHNKSK